MSTGMTRIPSLSLLSCAAVLLVLLPPPIASAQQYLGNARQRCQGSVTITTPGGTLQVRPFEARSAEVNNSTVRWQCTDQQQAADIQCPPHTNKVLVDRSQGGSIFSIICLQK
jgi:hypothetical protein